LRPAGDMHPLARAGRNLVLKTTGEVLARISFFFLFIYAARMLGAEEFGIFSYAATLAALALVGMDLGLNMLFVRDGAQKPSAVGGYAGTMLALKLGLAALVMVALLVFCLAKGHAQDQIGLILAVTLVQILWGLSELGVAGLNALERMDQEALVKSTGRLAALIFAGGLLYWGAGLWGLVAGLILANLYAAGLSLWLLKTRAGFSLRMERGFLVYLLKEALPLALTNVFVLVFVRVDIVMLELMGRSFTEIGWYAAGVRVIDGVGMVPIMVAGASLPVLASLAKKDTKATAKLYSQAQRFLLILCLPAAMGLWVVRDQVALTVYGQEFAETARAFLWLAPVLAFLFINYLQLNSLTALGKQKLCALATGLCVLVNVGLNLWLIPSHGFMGAAAATLLTEIVLFAFCAWFIHHSIGASGLAERAWRPALAALIMGLSLYWLTHWPLVALLALGLATYAIALLALRGLTMSELRDLRHIMRSPDALEGGSGPQHQSGA
jgi:O-antigen/teichoic acid export membrane protein